MAKIAAPRITRDENDNLRIEYVDLETGNVVSDAQLVNYEILDAHSRAIEEMGAQIPEKPKTTENPLEEDLRRMFSDPNEDHQPGEGRNGQRGDVPERTGFNAYGPDGKDITDTKLGRMGVGFMGGMGGKALGAGLGLAVGGPIGALAGGVLGGMVGKKTFQDTSPYGKAKKKAKEAEEAKKSTEKKGILTRGLEKIGVLDDDKGLLTRGLEAVGVLDSDEDKTKKMAEQTVNDLLSDDPEVSANAAAGVIGKNPLGVGGPTASKPGYNPNDPAGLGRVSLNEADFSGLHPDVRAKVEGFRTKANELGIANQLTVDQANMRRTPEDQQALFDQGPSVTKAKNSYHIPGFAVDISPLNPEDQETWGQSRALAKSLGFGLLGAWDPAHMQAQVPGMTAKSLAAMPTDAMGNAILSPEQSLNIRDDFVPTPTEKPAQTQTKNVSRDIIDQARNVSLDRLDGVDMTQASPAQLSNMGFGPPRSKEDRQQMAFAIAGELSPSQLAALANNDPNAQNEFANIVSTMENRVQSETFDNKTLSETLTGSQYNSMLDSKVGTTARNFGIYGDTLTSSLDDFYGGAISPTTPDATHYYNPDIANPGWGASLVGAQQVGNHRFGSLVGEYTPGKAYNSSLSRYAGAQINNQTKRGFSPDMGFASEGPNFHDTMDSPSEKAGGSRFGGSGLGYSAGGSSHDSPSESGGSRFGGSGLGSSSHGSVSHDKSSFGGGPVDKGEKGWGGSSGSTSSKSGPSSGSKGLGGSPTNDGGGKSKSPGGGF